MEEITTFSALLQSKFETEQAETIASKLISFLAKETEDENTAEIFTLLHKILNTEFLNSEDINALFNYVKEIEPPIYFMSGLNIEQFKEYISSDNSVPSTVFFTELPKYL